MFAELLKERLGGIVELSLEQFDLLERHYELLTRWNKTLNLTRIEGAEEVIQRHYCESLFLASYLPIGRLAIADVGSGAGFPGFPVAVLRPESSVTLIEAHQRKSVFLREASRKLVNVEVLGKRAEDVGERFDHVISRAVSYQDLAPVLRKLAPNADLLTGAEEPPLSIGFVSQHAILMPWWKQRFLRTGSFT